MKLPPRVYPLSCFIFRCEQSATHIYNADPDNDINVYLCTDHATTEGCAKVDRRLHSDAAIRRGNRE